VTVIDAWFGSVEVHESCPSQVTTFVSDLIDDGSASRARNVRTLLVQILEQGAEFGLATRATRGVAGGPRRAPRR